MAGQSRAGKAAGFAAMKPQLVVASLKADEAVEFYKAAFGAEEVNRSSFPKITADPEAPPALCVELKIGGSSFLVCDQTDDHPLTAGLTIRLETDDVEATMKKAVGAGAAEASEVAEFGGGGCCGGVVGEVKDPFGVVWTIASVGMKNCGEPEAAA